MGSSARLGQGPISSGMGGRGVGCRCVLPSLLVNTPEALACIVPDCSREVVVFNFHHLCKTLVKGAMSRYFELFQPSTKLLLNVNVKCKMKKNVNVN